MADLYPSYTALAAAEVEGTSYERRSVPVTGSSWCSIAIHGGGIEPGSGEVARSVGVALMSHYEFAGIKSSGNSTLHVTSTNFDEPNCQSMVTASRRCLSFHGYTGTTGVSETSIGGADTATISRVREELQKAGFVVVAASQEINGNDPANIANKTTIAAGVQVEMSAALRASFFPNGDTTRAMRDSGQRTAAFDAYVAAMRAAFNGRGQMSLGSINVGRWATQSTAAPDLDISASVSTSTLAAGGPHFAHLVGRFTNTDNCYLARLAFNTNQTLTLTLRKRVAGTETLLATALNSSVAGLTHAADRMFRIRLQVAGSTLRAKVWLDGSVEPEAWSATATDTSLSSAGSFGARSILSSANTNTLPVVFSYDDFQQLSAQTFTVVRSVNGVVKAQKPGTTVDVAAPSPVAL